MKIKLYSTGCPKCQVLKKKLDAKNIFYDLETDIDKISGTGFSSVPLLEVDGKIMPFAEAVDWVNKA